MPTQPHRTPGRSVFDRARRRGPVALVGLVGLAIVATNMLAPTMAAARTAGSGAAGHATSGDARHDGSALGDGRSIPIGRAIGAGHRVDAKQAARAAAAAPRPLKATVRLQVDLGARSATAAPKNATRMPVGGAALRQTTGLTIAPQVAANVQPAPVITTEFAGIARADACACEPPDP